MHKFTLTKPVPLRNATIYMRNCSFEIMQELAKMGRSATSFTGLLKHTQQEQGKEERFTLMMKEAKLDGTKQGKLEQFLLVEVQ